VEQELLILPEHLSSSPVFSGVRITRSLVLYICFVDRCLSFSTNAAGSTIKAIHVVVISRRKLLLLSECMFVFENITVRIRVRV
jgi:hypothetical protein